MSMSISINPIKILLQSKCFFILFVLLLFLSGCSSTAKVVSSSITIKGKINNTKEIEQYNNEKTCLQLIEKKTTNYDMMGSDIHTLVFVSEFPSIKILANGIIEYKTTNIKYDTEYFIAIQMLNAEYSSISLPLCLKNKTAAIFRISSGKNEVKEGAVVDLGDLFIFKQ